jgi:predicted  nucleic acid-binding Zn-ribbon protein
MKLLFCTSCGEVFSLKKSEVKCSCLRSGGKYLDDINAEYYGTCIPLGFSNTSFAMAWSKTLQAPSPTTTVEFTAFVVSPTSRTFRRKDKNDG